MSGVNCNILTFLTFFIAYVNRLVVLTFVFVYRPGTKHLLLSVADPGGG